ncbi:hypothetical protein ACNJYD_37365 [Bradyrhizobium sp. DASA03005]|uniref:hypothetical protein n=1 Tax=Bradyrhizobium sp. SPXBL-02 TaxID=3395912 RepID=UPI003F6E7058
MGNNTNIFPNQIHEFPMIDVPVEEQDKIVRELDSIVEKFDTDLAEAKALRSKLDKILLEALDA